MNPKSFSRFVLLLKPPNHFTVPSYWCANSATAIPSCPYLPLRTLKPQLTWKPETTFLLTLPRVLPRHGLHLSQQSPKLSIIHLHPVIQIQADALVGVVAKFFVEFGEFSLLFVQGGDFFF